MENITQDDYKSKYLDDEHPILIKPIVARALNSDRQAYFLQQVLYWMKVNRDNKRGFREGKQWTYNTLEQWHEQFPWLSVRTIQRIIGDLKEKGILITGNYNKKKYDKTVWYSINERKLDEAIDEHMTVWTKCPYGSGQNDQKDLDKMAEPIPETLHENNAEEAAASKPFPIKEKLNQVKEHFIDLYELYCDTKPSIKSEEEKALLQLLQDHSAENVNNMVTLMFQDTDPYWKREGYPLIVFAKQRNKFAARLAERKKAAGAETGNRQRIEEPSKPFAIVYGSTSWDDFQARQRDIERELIGNYEEGVNGEPAGAQEAQAGISGIREILRG